MTNPTNLLVTDNTFNEIKMLMQRHALHVSPGKVLDLSQISISRKSDTFSNVPSSESDILARVITVISDYQGIPTYNFSRDDKISDLGLDSLDQVEVIMALEDEFGFEVNDEKANKIKTIQDLADLFKTRKY